MTNTNYKLNLESKSYIIIYYYQKQKKISENQPLIFKAISSKMLNKNIIFEI